ncbi:oxidoreductase [Actinospongicola halichondriae]|uniref:oxidoreductase n=1 Tax=Actinospongicola halichondriae TaxID=3236844 RepID=UPI003D4B6E01
MTWSTADIPDQSGRVAIVTGSNTGLGFETAAELARAGATVVLACRTPSKADEARRAIEARTGNGAVQTLALDLGDLSAIRDAAAETLERWPRLDLLINNAGVMIPPKSTTVDGFELQFGTNHLGHFAYTGQVLSALSTTHGSRIVTVSSIAHRDGRMHWDDLQWERSYNRMAAYGQSKLANLLFTFELDRRLRTAGAETIALAAHPGVSATELARHIPLASLPGVKQVASALLSATLNSAADGALPSLRAATDPEAAGSLYYGSTGYKEMRGAPDVVMPSPHAVREADWERLWSLSEEFTGVTFPV